MEGIIQYILVAVLWILWSWGRWGEEQIGFLPWKWNPDKLILLIHLPVKII